MCVVKRYAKTKREQHVLLSSTFVYIGPLLDEKQFRQVVGKEILIFEQKIVNEYKLKIGIYFLE